MENGFSEIARWRDGEMGREGKNKFYFFTKREREKEIKLRMEN